MYTQPGKMIKETHQTKYVVKVRGVAVSAPASQQLAEAALIALPPEQRLIATIVPVTSEGKEMLFE